MGLIDALRSAFGSQCQELVKYHARTYDFKGLGLGYPAVNVSLAGIKTDIVKLEQATEVARNLDMYQFLMCKLTHEVGKDHPIWEKLIRARAVALCDLTAFGNTLVAYKADPKSQAKNLSKAVRQMQGFMNQVRKEILEPELSTAKKDSEIYSDIRALQNVERIQREKRRKPTVADARASLWSSYAPTAPLRRTLSPAQKRAKSWAQAMSFGGLKESDLETLVKVLSDS